MKWPGTSDPYKRRKTVRFLIITTIIGFSVAMIFATVQLVLNQDNPLKVCINDRLTPYKISATLDLWVDGNQAEIPANIGFKAADLGFLETLADAIFGKGDLGDCQRSMYTLTGDGTIHAEWEEEYPFELGHFLWMWDFPLRDMEQSKSVIYVNGEVSPHFISVPFQDGFHYRAEFVSKDFDESVDRDFMPPARDE